MTDLTTTLRGTFLPEGASVPHVKMNAFNLTPGITFVTDDEETRTATWIVMTVGRAMHNERVFVWARRGDLVIEGPGESVPNRSFDFDYCTPVAVVGNVLNYMDPDDNDWGN